MKKSLHEEHGPKAVGMLRGLIKANVKAPAGYEVEDHGNGYYVSKGGETVDVPLFAAKEVFKALAVFG